MSSTFNFNSSSEAGFSLLELAIVLVVIGLIGGVSLPLLKIHMHRSALVKTQKHQDYVIEAIAAFVAKNNRFPCPADPMAAAGAFGISKVSCQAKEAIGILPFKTLGISEVFAKDGFKKFMTYVVEPNLTKPYADLKNEEGGFLTVKDEAGNATLVPFHHNASNPNFIALILISHGESGAGAYLENGSGGENANRSFSSTSQESRDGNFIFLENAETLLRWESRDQFLQNYLKHD